MAVNRETIEIQLVGANRVRDLERDLNAAERAAAGLNAQIDATREELRALGVEQRTFNANTRAIGGQRRLVRGAQRDPRFTAGLSRAEATAIREDLRLRAESINEQLRGRALEGRALRNRIRFARQQEGRERAALAENRGLNDRLVRARDIQIGLIQDGNQLLRRELRSSRSQSRQRITATRRSRYEQTITRIGGEAELGAGSQRRIAELRQRERRVSQQLETLDEAVAASRRSTLAQRESLAERRFSARSGFAGELRDLRASLLAGGSRARFNASRGAVRLRVQESESNFAEAAQRVTQASDANERAFESTRRSLTVELGSIAEGIREVLRTDKGIKRGADTERRLSERLRELVRSGATQGTTADGRIIAPSTVEDVERRLSRASGFRARGDIEASNRLLSSAERTISAAERELNLRKKITRENEAQSKSAVSLNKQREKALDTENDRTIKFQGLQRKLNELRAGGVVGPGLQRAESLIGRISTLEQAGDIAQSNRLAKQVSGLLSSLSSIQKRLRAGRQITAEEAGMVVGPEQLALPDKKMLNAASRGIQRITTNQEAFNQKVASGTRFQEKFNQEQDRLRKIYGVQGPVGTGPVLPRGQRAAAAPAALDPAEARSRLNRALNSGITLTAQLNTLGLKGVDVTQRQASLQNALNNARQDTFELTQENLRSLERELEATRSLIGAQKAVTAEEEKQAKLRKASAQNLPRIRRDTLTGLLGDIRESGVAGQVQLGGRGTESAINQIVQTFNRSVGVQGGRPGQQLGLSDLAKVSKASARELGLLAETLSMVRAGMRSTDKGFDEITNTLGRVNREIQRQDPDADFLTRRLGVRGGRAASEGLIGGAFPLLFGQGIGAAAGGALGGGLGGFAGGMLGFGLSLAGTAIGTAIDGVMQAAQDTGEMLRDLTGNFDQIKEAGLLASTSQEKLIQSLLDAGNKTAAYSIIQTELNNKLGVDGVSKLRAAADAGERMQRAMAELGKQIEIFVAGPLTDFLNRVAGFIERTNLENQVSSALAAAPAEARAVAQAQLAAAQRAQVQQNQALPFGQRVGAELGSRLGIFNPFGSPGEATYGLPRFGDLPQQTLQDILNGLRSATPPPPQTEGEKRSAATRDAETALANAQRDLQVASKELESIDLLKGFQQQLIAVRREQEDIDRQSFEIRRDYERQIADIRENVENRVLQISQDNKRKEIDLIIKQGEIRQAQFRNATLALQGALAGDELASSLADAVTTYLSSQLSAQDQIEQRRLQFELEISNQQIEIEKFKGDIAKNVSRLNLDTAERIQAINLNIARRNEDAARNNFELEKKITSLKFKASTRELVLFEAETKAQLAQAQESANRQPLNQYARDLVAVLEAQLAEITKGIDQINDLARKVETTPAPPLIRPIAPVSARGVSTAGVDTAFARGAALSRQFQQLEDQLAAIIKGGDIQQLLNELDRIALGSGRQLAASLSDAIREYGVATGDLQPIIDGVNQSYANLAAELGEKGVVISPEIQKALDQYKKIQILLEELAPTQRFYTEAIAEYSNEIGQLKSSIGDLLGPTSEYEKQLQRINESGGLEVNPEENRTLLEAAKNVDRLREKLQALNALNDLAAGWTDSFIEFNKQLLRGEGLVKSLKSFLEGTADRALDVILEFTLRPMQEKMFKDLAKFLGFEAEKNPMLKPLDSINENTANTFKELGEIKRALIESMPKAQPVTPAAVNSIVPASGGLPASQQIYPADPRLNQYGVIPGAPAQPTNRSAGSQPGIGTFIGGPQSSLPLTGVGGPDLPRGALLGTASAGGISAAGLSEDVRLRALKDVESFKVLVDKELKKITDLSWLNQYTGQLTEYINNGAQWRRGRPPEEIGAMQADMRAAAEKMIADRISELAVKVQDASAGASKLGTAADAAAAKAESLGERLDQAAAPVNINAQTQATAAKKTEDAGNKQAEALKRFGQVAGASIQTLSGVAMAVGGAQMIGKGGTYNTLMGIAGIFGGISSVASGISGFGKAFGGPAGGSIAPGPVAQQAGVQYRPGFYGPGFAKGGRPDPYKPAWVGEEGMELWVPDRPGTIISNDNLDDLYVPGLDDSDSPPVPAGRYSRQDSGGFSAESSYDQSGAPLFYGRSAPYQRSETTREIDRLERVASNPRDLPPIKYETQRINQYEFVTPDQLEESNARTAKAARAQTIRELTDSLKTRKRIGL